ncbi:MAG: lactate utilization protein [Clostridiales bacterium]|nr:lactate utilization protein [Clostridiales bacterium]
MTPLEMRKELQGQRVVKGLQNRNMEAWYVKTKEAALEKALSLIPEGSSVGWGGSASIQEIGLKDAIRHGNYRAVDRETAKSPEEAHEIMRQVLLCDYFLGSTNAVTEDGILVNIDGNANRLAAFCFGPTHVLLIVGMNKVVKNEEAAMLRARNEAAPINAMRFSINTPCHKNGCCGDCVTPDTICCQFLTTRYSKVKGRIQVILVEEDLGY